MMMNTDIQETKGNGKILTKDCWYFLGLYPILP